MLEWLLFLLLRYFNSLFGVLNWMLICRQKADRRHTSSGLCASLMISWSLLAQYVCIPIQYCELHPYVSLVPSPPPFLSSVCIHNKHTGVEDGQKAGKAWEHLSHV